MRHCFAALLISGSVILAMIFGSVYYPEYLQNISQRPEFFLAKNIFSDDLTKRKKKTKRSNVNASADTRLLTSIPVSNRCLPAEKRALRGTTYLFIYIRIVFAGDVHKM